MPMHPREAWQMHMNNAPGMGGEVPNPAHNPSVRQMTSMCFQAASKVCPYLTTHPLGRTSLSPISWGSTFRSRLGCKRSSLPTSDKQFQDLNHMFCTVTPSSPL